MRIRCTGQHCHLLAKDFDDVVAGVRDWTLQISTSAHHLFLMNADRGPRSADYDIPTISFQSPNIRLKIVASYWLVFILGLPLWWITTSIERLALPVERVKSTARATEV